jgi:hypothetical protein
MGQIDHAAHLPKCSFSTCFELLRYVEMNWFSNPRNRGERLTVAYIHCTIIQFVLKNCARGVRVVAFRWCLCGKVSLLSSGESLLSSGDKGAYSSIVWSE